MKQIRIEDKEQKDVSFSDKLDVYKYIGDIKLRIKDDISADFVLAKLDEKNKEGIIEMTSNAYYSKNLILNVLKKAKERGYTISKKEEDDIINTANAIFDEYMKRIYMTVILNRNIDGNYLINVLSEYGKKEEVDMTPVTEKENTITNIKDSLAEKPENNKK